MYYFCTMTKREIVESFVPSGKSGIYIPQLMQHCEISLPELNKILRQLYEEKVIYVRKGLNGPLIFKHGKAKI
jgi:hypothetical protein